MTTKGLLNKLKEEGLVSMATVAFVAPPKSGKTLLLTRLVKEAVAQGLPVLYVNSEDMSVKKYLEAIGVNSVCLFIRKNPIDVVDFSGKVVELKRLRPQIEKSKVVLMNIPGCELAIASLGYYGKIVYRITGKEGGKPELVPSPSSYGKSSIDDIEDSVLGKVCEVLQPKIIIWDSITATFAIGYARVEFPVRSAVIDIWRERILRLAYMYRAYIFGAAHESKDPANPYAKPNIKGGKLVSGFFKYQIYLKAKHERGATVAWEAWFMRHPAKQEWMFWFEIKDKDGVLECSETRIRK